MGIRSSDKSQPYRGRFVHTGDLLPPIPPVPGSSQSNPAESAEAIKTAAPSAADGLYWIKPSGYGGAAFQVYCKIQDVTANGVTVTGGWMHVATIHDEASWAVDQSTNQIWAYYLHRDANGTRDNADNRSGYFSAITGGIGTQSFTANFKNPEAYNNIPMTQMLMCDSGDTLRPLWYTNAISQVNSTSHFFGNGGNVWVETTQRQRNETAGGYRNLVVTDFGNTDDVFGANPSRVIFGFGETSTTDAGNSDRSMITRFGSTDGVSHTQGIGASRQDTGGSWYRNVDPTFRDYPGSISSTYNYTMWVK